MKALRSPVVALLFCVSACDSGAFPTRDVSADVLIDQPAPGDSADIADASVDTPPIMDAIDSSPTDTSPDATADALLCPTGRTECRDPSFGSNCFDLQSNNDHCGDCRTACGQPGSTCTNGACACTDATRTACTVMLGDGSRVVQCKDLTSDVSACGMCNRYCPAVTNATSMCVNGTCGWTCMPGFAECNMNYVDGCEASLQTDRNNCGICRSACAAGRSCINGRCV